MANQNFSNRSSPVKLTHFNSQWKLSFVFFIHLFHLNKRRKRIVLKIDVARGWEMNVVDVNVKKTRCWKSSSRKRSQCEVDKNRNKTDESVLISFTWSQPIRLKLCQFEWVVFISYASSFYFSFLSFRSKNFQNILLLNSFFLIDSFKKTYHKEDKS